MTTVKNLQLVQGSTFVLPVMWGEWPMIYKAITGILKTAPVRLTVTGHGAPNGFEGAVTAVNGMREINAQNPNALRRSDYHVMTVIDADTVEMNDVNAAEFHAYTGGGYLQYATPVDLTGFTARLAVKRRLGIKRLVECSVGGTSGTTKPTGAGTDGMVTWVAATSGNPESEWQAGATYIIGDVIDLEDLIRLTDANGKIVIDVGNFKTTVVFSDADTEALSPRGGAYDLEMVSPTGIVTKVLSGDVTVGLESS